MDAHQETRIPPELVYHILDHCGRDIPTLQSCTLVSTQWLRIARTRLFSTLIVIPPVASRTFISLLRWLDSDPEAQAFVTSLKVQDIVTVRPMYPEISFVELWQVVARLPSLCSLNIGSLTVVHSPAQPHGHPQGRVPPALRRVQLRLLSLTGTRFAGILEENEPLRSGSLAALLSIFSSVCHLDLHGVHYHLEERLPQTPFGNSPASVTAPDHNTAKTFIGELTLVRLSKETSLALAKALIKSIQMENLVTLNFLSYENYCANLPTYQLLIGQAAGLGALGVSLPSYLPPGQPMLSLGSCRAMKKITFTSNLGGLVVSSGQTQLGTVWSHIMSTLSTIPSPHSLKEIHLTMARAFASLARSLRMSSAEWEKLGTLMGHVRQGVRIDTTDRRQEDGTDVEVFVEVKPAIWALESERDVSAVRDFFAKGLADISKRYTIHIR